MKLYPAWDSNLWLYRWKMIRFCSRWGLLSSAALRFFLRIRPLDSVAESRFYRRLYDWRIRRVTTGIAPTVFLLESSSLCNARCRICPHSTLRRSKNTLDEGLFRKAVDEACGYFRPRLFWLSGLGEPLLDESLVRRVVYIKERSSAGVWIFTNGSLLSAALSRRLIEAKLDRINVSLNAADAADYSEETALDYQTVVQNLETLLSERQRLAACKPTITVSLTSPLPNRRQAQALIRRWIGLVDAVHIQQAENWGGALQFRGRAERRTAFPCRFPFVSMNVLSNGDVVPCCRDYEGHLVLANIRNQTLLEIWNGDRLVDIREKHLRWRFDEIPLCRECDTNRVNPATWWSKT